ncbi:MAG: glycosyltransferase family 39 protein, partial [Candidatus Omnitrophica bacterium]|nr:glycosyltransferase family 39 protein [Candidatus Omnitrophota bacterium]
MNPTKTLLSLIAIIFISVTVISFRYSIIKPFTLDEIEEARMAQKIPVMGTKTFHPDGGKEDLGHPLLYSYTNAVFYILFGSSEIALRSYGALFFALSLVVLLLMFREACPGRVFLRSAMFIGGFLYALNPLLIQHSMLLNADNNISAFAIICFVYLFFKFEKYSGREFIKSRAIIALAIAFNYMCKEVTPTFLMASVIAYRAINRDKKKLVIDALTIVAGMAIFWGIWLLYCHFSNTDILSFIKFTAMKKGKKVTIHFLLRNFQHVFVLLKWPFYWTGAPFFLVVFIYMLDRLKAFVRKLKLEREDFVLLAGCFMFTPFVFVKASIDMMKYQYPSIPVFIFCITFFLLKTAGFPEAHTGNLKNELKRLAFLFFIFLIPASVAYYFMGDYILAIWSPYSKYLGGKFYVYYYTPIVLVSIVMWAAFRKRGFYVTVIWSLLLCVYPINIGLNLNQTKPYTTAEGFLNYGESGLTDTVNYLREHVDTGKLLIARKD